MPGGSPGWAAASDGGEIGRQRREREAGALGGIGDEAALAARVRERDHARAARSRAGTERLEVLEPVGDVVHGDRAVCRAERRHACAEPTIAPEWASAAREAACERPLASTITGLPARAASASASANARGSPDRLEREPDDRRPVVGHERREPVGGVAPDLVAARDDDAQAEPRAGVQQRLSERSGVHDASDSSGAQVAMGDRAEPWRRATRDGDAHAVRADERHVRGDAQLAELGPGDGARLAILGAEPGHDQEPRAGRDRLARCNHDRRRPDRERAHVRSEREILGSRYDTSAVGRPTRAMNRDGLGTNTQAQPEL